MGAFGLFSSQRTDRSGPFRACPPRTSRVLLHFLGEGWDVISGLEADLVGGDFVSRAKASWKTQGVSGSALRP